MSEIHSGATFEDEVRHVARLLWGTSESGGAAIVDGRERDGVFETDEIIYVLEATCEKTKEKIERDGRKTSDLVKELRRSSGKHAQGYLITQHEPTAHQRQAAEQYSRALKIISFDDFLKKLVDSRTYLNLRKQASFGSIYDYSKETFDVARDEFISPTIFPYFKGEKIQIADLSDATDKGGRFVLLAEYGTGKSMCLRELYFRQVEKFHRKQTFRFPVYINLREHVGQKNCVELLERHARNISFHDPFQLVRAWRAGYTDLFIDGFDELSTRGWVGDAQRVRELRRATHAVLRDLIRGTPDRSAVFVTGRAGYFDTIRELQDALGIGSRFNLLRLLSFDDEQVRRFLERRKLVGIIPSWVPTRPLLLGYLASRHMLDDVCQIVPQGSFPRGQAWSALLEMIARREAGQLEGTDSDTLLRFFARLATVAKQSGDGLGRFSPIEIENVFFSVTGRTPVDDDRNLLLRLPGLGSSSDSDSNRTFVDRDLADAAYAQDVFNFISNPFGDANEAKHFKDVRSGFSDVGIEVAAHLAAMAKMKPGQISVAVDKASQKEFNQFSYDLYSVYVLFTPDSGKLRTFDSCEVGSIDVEEISYLADNIVFSNSIIENVYFPTDCEIGRNLEFHSCMVGNVFGRMSESDLPKGMFVGCVFDQFADSADRNNAILSTDLPHTLKVLIICLRKLFQQKGSGRRMNALFRGLDSKSAMLVPEIIDLLEKHRYASVIRRKGSDIVHPNRAKTDHVLQIINRPNESDSDLVKSCLSL